MNVSYFDNSNSMPFYCIHFLDNITGRYCGFCGTRSFDGYKEKRPTYINRWYETHTYVRVLNKYCGHNDDDNNVCVTSGVTTIDCEKHQKRNIIVEKL